MKIEITRRGKWQLFTKADIEEMIHYKDLLYMLVKRDITVLYKQTILGFLWAIIKPITQMVIFTLIFGKFAGIESQIPGNVPYALFSFIALVPWAYFSAALTNSTGSLISSAGFITKVYFPRVLIPLTPVLSKLVDFAIAFVILICLLFYYGFSPDINIIFLPLLLLIMIGTSFGVGLWLSALAIQYRDVSQMVQFIIQILLYLTPVIWPITYIPEKLRLIYGIYPMAGVIEGFRVSLLGQGQMPWDLIGMGAISTVVLLFTGLWFFRNKENIFADVV